LLTVHCKIKFEGLSGIPATKNRGALFCAHAVLFTDKARTNTSVLPGKYKASASARQWFCVVVLGQRQPMRDFKRFLPKLRAAQPVDAVFLAGAVMGGRS
jgi:hypothetical protein